MFRATFLVNGHLHPGMTLSQAAEWAGKTRSTVFKAIKSGRLSARRTADGQWMIDRPSWPASTRPVTREMVQGTAQVNAVGQAGKQGKQRL